MLPRKFYFGKYTLSPKISSEKLTYLVGTLYLSVSTFPRAASVLYFGKVK